MLGFTSQMTARLPGITGVLELRKYSSISISPDMSSIHPSQGCSSCHPIEQECISSIEWKSTSINSRGKKYLYQFQSVQSTSIISRVEKYLCHIQSGNSAKILKHVEAKKKSRLHRIFPQGAKILKHVEAKKKSRLHMILPHSAKILKHVEAKKKSGLQGGSHTVPLYTHPCINIHIRA